MAQLLAGGIIVFGLIIIALAIFLVRREKSVQPVPVVALETEQHTTPTTTPEASIASAPIISQHVEANMPPEKIEQEEILSSLPVSITNNAIRVLHEDTSLPVWWHEQFHSLTTQLQELREHAKDVERQVAILGEIATLATELEDLQRKHAALPEGKISLFPMKVHRQPTDVSYMTDKRPAVRKYTIKAM